MSTQTVIEKMAEVYPQLYLDPDTEEIDAYKKVVLEGEQSEKKSLAHFMQDPMDREELVDTPAGKVQVVSLRNRRDYEVFVRCMMAAKEGPRAEVPASQGASTLVAFNWPRIYAHRDAFLAEQTAAGIADPDWSTEFRRFISVKENYQDLLIVLSWGPYSNVSAEEAGQSGEAWPELSYTIRKNHELTHVICRRLYPDRISAVWDELVADAIGIYAAFGTFLPELEKTFLGYSGTHYVGGRLGNYTDDPAAIAVAVCNAMDSFSKAIADHPGAAPFDLIPVLQEYQDCFLQETE